MKKIGLLVLMMACFASFSFSQNNGITKHCKEYLQDASFKSVYVNPKLFKMITKVSPDKLDADVQKQISQLEGLHIVSTEASNSRQYYTDSKNKLKAGSYEELMEIKEGNNDEVLYLIKESGSKISELIMVLNQPGYFSLVSFEGDIDLKLLAKLGENLDIEGMKYLKKLENK